MINKINDGYLNLKSRKKQLILISIDYMGKSNPPDALKTKEMEIYVLCDIACFPLLLFKSFIFKKINNCFEFEKDWSSLILVQKFLQHFCRRCIYFLKEV